MSRPVLRSFAAAMIVAVCAARCSAPAQSHTIAIDSIRYQPESLTVTVGDSVVWVNQDPFPHTVTSAAAGFDSHTIDAGKSWTYTATRRGDFPYTCTFHPMMKGRLLVK
jgi:plastocyanin